MCNNFIHLKSDFNIRRSNTFFLLKKVWNIFDMDKLRDINNNAVRLNECGKTSKGRTIKYLRGGLGNFFAHDFFSYLKHLARIFFSIAFLCKIFFSHTHIKYISV